MSVDVCPLCEELVTESELADAHPIGVDGAKVPAHRECLLRTVMGGIGHLEDHAYWCGQMHDPDGGRSFRQSALEVDDWVAAGRFRG